MLICLTTLLFACNLGGVSPATQVKMPDITRFPGEQPQVAVAANGTYYVVYGSGKAVYCAKFQAGDREATAPVKVAEPGALALGMRRGPRVAVSGKWVVVSAIAGKVGKGKDEDLLTWRSDDGGKTWQGPVRVNGVPASAREGLHHLAAAADGTLCLIWLDLRQKGTRVFGALSTDNGATWQERLIYESPDGYVCECCQPVVAWDASGHLYVMWRNYLGGARDMYLAVSKDRGKTFAAAAKLGTGTWPLTGCPMDGGALAVGPKGDVAAVWMRKKELYRSGPEGAETHLGPGEQGWIAPGATGFYLVWTKGRPGPVLLSAPAEKVLQLSARGNFPVVAGTLDGRGAVVAAWEEGDGKERRVAVAVLTTGVAP